MCVCVCVCVRVCVEGEGGGGSVWEGVSTCGRLQVKESESVCSMLGDRGIH